MADDPVCSRCKATSSLMWQKNKEGQILCLACSSDPAPETTKTAPSTNSERQQQQQQPTATAPSNVNNNVVGTASSTTTTTGPGRRTRLRNTKGRYGKAAEKAKGPSNSPAQHQDASSSGSGGVTSSSSQRKGGGTTSTGRRSLLKGRPTKAPKIAPTIVTSDTIMHKGTVYEAGDIVSILDEDGQLYYALIRGFLEDQYAEKYAVLTWLLPTVPNPKTFDPALFVLGPEEETPRGMEYLDFVTRSPHSNGFLSSLRRDSDLARLWTIPHHKLPLKPTS